MGRSVSHPSNAIVCFGHIEVDEFRCDNCGDTFNEHKEDDDDVKRCPHCGAHEDDTTNQSEWAAQDEFDWLKETFKEDVLAAFHSAYEEDAWLDREDHALASNRFAYFGISEYCGVIALWMSPKENDYGLYDGLRDHWLAQAEPKFRKLAESVLPNPLRLLGVMSNGEAVYQRVNP